MPALSRCCSWLALFSVLGCSGPPAAGPTTNVTAKNAPPTPDQKAADAKSVAVKVDAPHLPNAYRIHEKLISGGLPEGDEAFAELKELGIKTVISVDGAKPDLAMAKKYGMRYVHLPHGYDGVPDERGAELAKAVELAKRFGSAQSAQFVNGILDKFLNERKQPVGE